MRSPEGLVRGLLDIGVTRREAEVFWLVGDRLRNEEIAARLHLSERTVESHVSGLLRKLGGATRQAIVEHAARLRAPELPQPLSSFVGRERELDAVSRLVAANRLVTLTGPAGSGKTRLALQLAGSSAPPGRPVLVDLAVVPVGGDVEQLVAARLGVSAERRDVRGRLRAVVSADPYWLLLDNCEHVVEGVSPLVEDLLRWSTRLRVLATSLRPLVIPGEAVFDVPPLALPGSDDQDDVTTSPAGRLFAHRAAAVAPGFAVSETNAADVAAVCRLLDGLPLALELAAARVRTFSPAELRSRLVDRLERTALLADGPDGPAGRHRSLEAALSWSHGLLADDERLLFERCSVFLGSVDYDTVVAVAGIPPLEQPALARLFPRLLDRSMVAASRTGQRTEYRLLDSLRQFGAQRLSERGESQLMQARHAEHHLRRAVALASDLRGRDQAGALAWFEQRWPDIRVAVDWALQRPSTDTAWQFLAGVGSAWDVLGARAELFDWIAALEQRELPSGGLGVRAALTAAIVLSYRDVAAACTWARRAATLAEGGDDNGRALADLALGYSLTYAAERTAAIPHLERAARDFARLGDGWHEFEATEIRGLAEADPHVAIDLLLRAADGFGGLGDDVKRANCLILLAGTAVDLRTRPHEVLGWLDAGRALLSGAGSEHERLHADLWEARHSQANGSQAEARARLARLLVGFRRIGDGRCEARCLLGIGQAALAVGELDHAVAALSDCLALTEQTGDRFEAAAALRCLARARLEQGRRAAARSLLDQSDAAAQLLDRYRRAALPDDPDVRARLLRPT